MLCLQLCSGQRYGQGSTLLSNGRYARRLIQDRVPDEVLLRMHSLLEAPEPHKHVWEASTIVISTEMNVPLSRY